MMAETCLLAESAICYPPLYDDLRAVQARPTETAETVAIAAVAAAAEQDAKAILVLSTSGNTARLVSKYRPNIPIITGACISFLILFHTFAEASIKLLATNRQQGRFTYTVDVIPSGILSLVAYKPTSGRLTLITAFALVFAMHLEWDLLVLVQLSSLSKAGRVALAIPIRFVS